MELTIVDSTSWCEDKPPQFHFYTRDTRSGHDLMLGNVTTRRPSSQRHQHRRMTGELRFLTRPGAVSCVTTWAGLN